MQFKHTARMKDNAPSKQMNLSKPEGSMNNGRPTIHTWILYYDAKIPEVT
jgi:hypothetical protein